MMKLVTFKKPGKKFVKRAAGICGAFVILAGAGVFAAEKIEAYQEAKAYEAMVTMINNQLKETGTSLITKDEAVKTALQSAGVSENDAKFLEADLETDDDTKQAKYVYEVQFTYNGLEYEFEIDGIENTVLNSDAESVLD